MSGITVTIEKTIQAAAMGWYGHVLRKEGNILKEALNFEATGRRKRVRPKANWKNQLKLSSKVLV